MDNPIWARDLPLILAEVYAKLKTKLPMNPEHRLIDVVEWLGRIPTRYPRRVHVSDVLTRQRLLTLYETEGVTRIRKAMELGHSLLPFLGEATKSIRNRAKEKPGRASQNDLFFSDWGLHHFHLGADLANSGVRVLRTRRVLIAHLTQDEAYLLDVASHGKGFADTWGDTGYLETMYRNWPNVMNRHELIGMMPHPQANQTTAENYVELRQAGLMVPVVIDGKMFMGPGLGIATDRSSTLAVQRADNIRNELDAGENIFRKKYPKGDAFLFIGKDASSGYFIPEKNEAICVFPGRNNDSHVTEFFRRLLEESGIHGIPEGAIWIASGRFDPHLVHRS